MISLVRTVTAVAALSVLGLVSGCATSGGTYGRLAAPEQPATAAEQEAAAATHEAWLAAPGPDAPVVRADAAGRPSTATR